MFESANLQHQIGKAAYQREAASLRAALLNAQYDLKLDGRFPVLILIAGVEGAGKGAYTPEVELPAEADVVRISTAGEAVELRAHLAAGKVTVVASLACRPWSMAFNTAVRSSLR